MSTENPHQPPADFAEGPNGAIAYLSHKGRAPGLVWLGGFRSDMRGGKANFVWSKAIADGRSCLRFDYSGHGESSGEFDEGTISSWTSDAEFMLDSKTDGPQILIGSSMGGWIAGLLALRRPERVAGLVLIAPAPDFTSELMAPQFSAAEREALEAEGKISLPSEYSDEPAVITRALIEDGARNRILSQNIPVAGPVRILQGMADPDVPWRHGLRMAEIVESADVAAVLVKHGDHRLSDEDNLSRLAALIDEVAARIEGGA
ncbi:MAG: alpha/beta hydrolase [Parvularculaceae bacterium]